MKAMILAAGEGTRLKPLTNNIPKALLEIKGKPLLEHTINYLKHFGVDEIIINVHHFAEQIIDWLRDKKNFNIRIELSDETDKLLDTGGGLKKASWFFDDNAPFFLTTVDVITNLNLNKLYEFHIKSGALATLAVKKRPSTREFLFDKDYCLCGWKSNTTGEKTLLVEEKNVKLSIAFSTIHVISPSIFELITEEGPFPITGLYLRLAKEHTIKGFVHDESFWMEFGRIENIEKAEKSQELEKVLYKQ
ncbi:MAG: nucleotidyltransferase family protein [Bacteroidales bacterium]|nr:MAG: nucleotidyltransferase family protein [Bacteroidales bacterium]